MKEKNIKKGWKICKLIDIATINMGQSPKSEYYSENKDDIPFLQGCTEFGILYPEIRKYCNKPIKIANEGDILFSVRAPVGLINLSPNRCCIGRGLCSMNSIYHKDNYFLMYLLKGNIEYIKRFGQGSIYDAINKIELGNIELCIPESIDIQEKIGTILSNYDNLIENNHGKIQILEHTIQEIYKEWFVNFRFPGHEAIKIIDTGTNLGMIPQGWEIEKFSEAVYINPKIQIKKDVEYSFVGMEKLGKGAYVDTRDKVSNKSGSKFQDKDTLFARITPCLQNGKGGYVRFNNEEDIGIGSTEFIVFREKLISSEHTYCLSRDNEFRKHAEGSMVGASGRQRVQNQCFDSFLIPIPDIKTKEYFSEYIGPLFDEIFILSKENENLKETRDLLLPKLISGEIDVSELEIK